jgi:hypothetical protein
MTSITHSEPVTVAVETTPNETATVASVAPTTLHGTASRDGTWLFDPGRHQGLRQMRPAVIRVDPTFVLLM